ncbi:MAG: hypothetical protein ACOCRK_04840 [bacterium]
MGLSQDKWQDIVKIVREFGYRLGQANLNEQNMKFVWEVIINVKRNTIDDIEQAIRVNLQLCYILEKYNQIKTINSALYKIHYIFEQDIYYLEGDVKNGLNNFYKIIKSTFGDIDTFIVNLKDVKENLCFIRKRYHQQLIRRYNYLKKISLPRGRRYKSLRDKIGTVFNEIESIYLIVTDPSIFNKIIEEIDNIIEEYINIYIKEHNQYQQKLKKFYLDLFSLPEYKALEYLNQINVIKVGYNMKPIKKYIDTFFPDKCLNYNTVEIVEKKAKCKCGFTIGDPLTIPSLNKIKPMLKRGITEYIEKLQNERFETLFRNYLSYNNNSKLKKMLTIESDAVESYLDLIDDKLISDVNEAIRNTYPLKITLKEIAPRIVGIYPVNQLKILGKDLEKSIKEIIKYKIENMEYIDYNDIIINLIL